MRGDAIDPAAPEIGELLDRAIGRDAQEGARHPRR